MLSIIAQFTTEQDPTGILNQFWPVLSFMVPFITARIVDAGGRAWVKFGVSVAVALVAAVVSLAGQDWSDLFLTPDGLEVIVTRLSQVFALAYGVYFTSSQLLGRSINEMDSLRPESGLR